MLGVPGMPAKTIGLVAVTVMGVLAGACSGGSLGDGPGTGGTGGSGTAGTRVDGTGIGGTGIGGTGMGGRGGAGDLQLPGCVASVVAACAPEGTCTTGVNDAGATASYCFASGAHVALTTVASTLACGGSVTIASFMKPDGSPCFSFESYIVFGADCERTRYTWKNADGAVIATGLRDPYGMPTLTISCAGAAPEQACDSGALGGTPNSCCNITELGLPTCSYPFCDPGACPN